MAPALREDAKTEVAEFWERASCGEIYAAGETARAQLAAHAAARYSLEPYIHDFADFASAAGRDVLEIGVGMGADHLQWAKAGPRRLVGVDLTARACAWTHTRLALEGHQSAVTVGDAERLPFPDESFDVVYSWGVLHHSPDTARAVREAYRVLRPGGTARVMVYHTQSLVGYMLWLRYALLAGRPTRTLRDIYRAHLESPGTKAYTPEEARELFRDFSHVETRVQLSCGDLLEGAAGQGHRGALLAVARRLWPRALVRRWLAGRGLFLLISAVK